MLSRQSNKYRFIPTHVGNAYLRLVLQSIITVHPHACGERGQLIESMLADSGSSPRMWGTLAGGGPGDTLLRFIPTHVGNALIINLIINLPTVHPHACGERMRRRYNPSPQFGSSPRMWGTPGMLMRQLCKIRFIPTHVGNAIC